MEGKSANGYRYYVCSRRNEQFDLCSESGLIRADDVEDEIVRVFLDHVIDCDYLQRLLDWTNQSLNRGLEGGADIT